MLVTIHVNRAVQAHRHHTKAARSDWLRYRVLAWALCARLRKLYRLNGSCKTASSNTRMTQSKLSKLDPDSSTVPYNAPACWCHDHRRAHGYAGLGTHPRRCRHVTIALS
jgi:hypothetical protein